MAEHGRGELTAAKRKRLPSSSFVFPEQRAFPIHDIQHARSAMQMCMRADHHKLGMSSPEAVCKKVRAAVKRRYGDKVGS